ncbi:MAG: SUMF1/EgtB/PvdO family nonheme iron enzyme [Nitrospira sp.]|nr:SUMF1/EgtB/PvdO family nonheme iron enzyme [Nitrospira sp.]
MSPNGSTTGSASIITPTCRNAIRPDRPAAGTKSLRGGSWKSRPIMLRTATRSGAPADQRSATVGFRCAKSVPPSAAP